MANGDIDDVNNINKYCLVYIHKAIGEVEVSSYNITRIQDTTIRRFQLN